MDASQIWQFPSITAVPLLAIGMGVLGVVVGAVLLLAPPKPNAWAGVRTPWTYADEGIWYESHRAFGWGMIASALVWPLYCPAGLVTMIIAGVGSLPFSWAKYAAKYGTGRTWNAEGGWTGYRPMAKCPDCGCLIKLSEPEELPTCQCQECGRLVLRLVQ